MTKGVDQPTVFLMKTRDKSWSGSVTSIVANGSNRLSIRLGKWWSGRKPGCHGETGKLPALMVYIAIF